MLNFESTSIGRGILPRRLTHLILAALLLAAPGLATAWPGNGSHFSAACGPRAEPAACCCQSAQEPEDVSACCCGGAAPCQVSSTPSAPDPQALPGRAGQPDSPALALAEANSISVDWVRLVRVGDEAPWRPPKPLYLRHSSLLF